MSAASDVAICNLALSFIGVRTLTSLSDNSKEARLCNTLYSHTLKLLQEEHRWNFCSVRDTLTATGTTPEWEYAHQFALPSGYLRMLKINAVNDYQREGNFIYSNDETMEVLYIQEITDTTKFHYTFTQALAYRLASLIVYPLQQDKTLKQMMEERAEWWLARARSVGAMESSAKELEVNTWTNSRL